MRSIDSKRIFDLILSAFLFIIVGVPLLILALCVKFSSRGSVFYKQERIGRHGYPFQIYKFRTMIVGADKQGPGITAGDDPRVTRIGRFLRRTKLDELPQIFNVLRGEMSFVGPRPESPKYVAHYTEDQRQVLKVRPGITGLTQLQWRHEEQILRGVANLEEYYLQQIMPVKLLSDLDYVRSDPCLRMDLKILLRTLGAVFHRPQS